MEYFQPPLTWMCAVCKGHRAILRQKKFVPAAPILRLVGTTPAAQLMATSSGGRLKEWRRKMVEQLCEAARVKTAGY